MSSFDLKSYLKDNNLTSTSQRLSNNKGSSKGSPTLLSEAKYVKKMRDLIVDKIGEEHGLKKMRTDGNFALSDGASSAKEIADAISDEFGIDVKVVKPKERVEWNSGKVEEISSQYKGLHFEYNGNIYNLKLSKSGGNPGVPSDAAYYEMGICVEYNKLQGMNSEEAMESANVDPEKYSSYEEHLTEVCEPIAKNLPNLGASLEQTGDGSFSPSSKWPSSDGTPKTDINGGKAHRISVKKKGGSQLASGASGDAKGVFQGGLGFYERYAKKSDEDVERIIDSIEDEFVKLNVDRSITEIKNMTEDAYIEWRTPKLKKTLRKLNIDATDKQINRHVRAELKAIGMISQSGKWKTWFIDGVEPLSERKIMDWFEDFWKSQPQEELRNDIKNVITAGIKHTKLDKEFKKIFDNKEFKSWCVYEAASGNFKFSGTNDINTSIIPVANKMLVFGMNGDVKVDGVDNEWSQQYSNKVKPRVSFKSSGRSKNTAFRLLSEAKSYADLSGFEKDANKIIEEEFNKLNDGVDTLFENYYNERKKVLNEYSFKGMLRKMKDIGKRLFDKMTNKIKSFYNNVIKRVLNNLHKMAKEGIRKFAEYLGIEIDGKAEINVQF